MPVLLPVLSSGEGLLLTSVKLGQSLDPSQALMQSRAALLALPGSKAGSAEVRVWVNPWSYSGLGSWYELPYINPSRCWGKDVLWSHWAAARCFLPLPTLHTAQTVLHPHPQLCPGLTPDLALCNKFQWHSGSSWLCPGGREAGTGPTGCAWHRSGSGSRVCAASVLPRAVTLILLNSAPDSWPSLPVPETKSSSGINTQGSLKMGKAVADPWGLRGPRCRCCSGAAALGDALGPFLSVCFASIPWVRGHQGKFATPAHSLELTAGLIPLSILKIKH